MSGAALALAAPAAPPTALAAAAAAWPGREAQLATLGALLGRPRDAAACVSVCGPPGSGKTGCVRAALAAAGHRAAYASCLECHAPRLLFEALLAQLAPPRARGAAAGAAAATPTPGRGRAGRTLGVRCTTLPDFIEALRAAAPRDGRATYLVIDEAQRLVEPRRWGAGGGGGGGAAGSASAAGAARAGATAGAQDLLGALLRLDELSGRNYGIVLISCAPWSAFRDGTGVRDPLPLLFPPYSSAALQRVLCAQAPPRAAPGAEAAAGGELAPLWRTFVGSMMGAFGGSCRNLHELRALLAPLWRRYTAPLAELRAAGKPAEPRVLYSLMAGARALPAPLGGAAQLMPADAPRAVLHPSLAVPLSAGALALAEERVWPIPIAGSGAGGAAAAGKLDFDLPSLSKFLLLAAFLAARTPAGADAVAFADGMDGARGGAGGGGGGAGAGDDGAGRAAGGGKRKKGGGGGGAGGAAGAAARHAAALQEAALRGPGVFSLERLLAIFQAILSQSDDADAEEDAACGGGAGGMRRGMRTPQRGRRQQQRRGAASPGGSGSGSGIAGDVSDDDDGFGGGLDGATTRRLVASSPFASPRATPLGRGGSGESQLLHPSKAGPFMPGGAIFSGPLLSDVFSQVASLCELGLLSRASVDPLELPRYRCAVAEPLARRLAANAGVQLERYLQQRPV
jgi:origin recognition complex subunit 5